MTLYIFGFPQSFGCDRACNDLTRFPVDAFLFFLRSLRRRRRRRVSSDEDSKGVSQRNHSQCPNPRVFATDSSDA